MAEQIELRSPEEVFNGDHLPEDLKWLMTSFNLPKNDPTIVLLAWHWKRVANMQDIGGYKPSADYLRCFDSKLLQAIATTSVTGYGAIGCLPPSQQSGRATTYDCLNEAWVTFWANPTGYPNWEKTKVTALFP
jgi:hypothetical protein